MSRDPHGSFHLMDWMRELRFQFLGLFRRRKLEMEMAQEMKMHLENETRRNVAGGMSPEEAHHEAQRSFGGAEQIKEQARDQRSWMWLEQLAQDLRYAGRMLVKNPGFSVVVVLTLGLGIGATTAMFSTASTVLFRALPYPNSDRLVALTETHQQNDSSGNPANFFEWQKQATGLENLAATFLTIGNLSGVDEPLPVRVQLVTANFFATVGVHPAIGRDFRSEEDQRGSDNVVILSHNFWVRHFGARSDALNQTIKLDNEAVTVVGVMPATFYSLTDGVEMWRPFPFRATDKTRHGNHFLDYMIGRLKPGATVTQVQSEVSVIASRLAQEFPDTNKDWGVSVKPLLDVYVHGVRTLIFALLGAVGFLLLIGCANIANLLLARAFARQKEIVLRISLGASRGRVVRQFMTESLLLALLGGTLGILLARWGMVLLVKFAPEVPRLSESVIDGRALAFSAVLTLLTGLAFGLVPALNATRIDLNTTLKSGSRGSTQGGQKSRGFLVASEIALALMLLVGAGLFVRSLMQLQKVNPGFQPTDAMTVNLRLPRSKYATAAQMTSFADQAVASFSALPSVRNVGAAQWLPLSENSVTTPFSIAGRPVDSNENLIAAYYAVTPGYAQAMGISLQKGRFFTDRDAQNAPHVAVISTALARRYFPNTDPIGQRIHASGAPEEWSEIVGVVGDVKAYSMQDDDNGAQIYEPFAQHPSPTINFVIRSAGSAAGLPAALRSAVQAVDKDQPVIAIRPLAGAVAKSFSTLNFTVFLFAVFSFVALALASLGIYGVMAYFVTQRTNEIGIRMALGAQRGNILFLVLEQGGRFVGAGLIVGLLGALGLSHLIQSMLFGIGARDLFTFAAVAASLAVVATIACIVPALRAIKIDPLIALRSE